MTTAEFLIGSDLRDALRDAAKALETSGSALHITHHPSNETGYRECPSEVCQRLTNTITRLRTAAGKAGLEL